jgi:imidazolonepropionase-like amidohydrolase
MSHTLIAGGQVLMRNGGWEPASVLLSDDVIIEVGRDLAAEAGTRVVDASGCWVVPGLIDAHVHLCFSMDSPRDEGFAQRLLKGARNAAVNLRAGITTVRDVGAMGKLNIELARAGDAGVVDAPRIVACGEFIAITGGHVHYWAREADGPDEVRKAAREQIKAGARLIKLMASGGAADPEEDPGAPQLSLAEMTAAVEVARRAGVKVAAHAHGEEAMVAALTAGVDTIEHATFLTPKVVDLLLEKQRAIVPTFAVYQEIAGDAQLPAAQREIARRVLDAKGPRFLDAVRQGVRYGVGTDAGSFYPPGALVREMELMVAVGLSPREVVLAATAGNAELLGMAGRLGTIEPGRLADILILAADPFESPGALRRIVRVFKGGKEFGPGSGS